MTTQGDALAAVAAEDMDALKLLGDLMEHNARSLGWTMEQLYEGERRAHEETREQLARANARLDLIERRVRWLLGGPDPDGWDNP